MLCLLAVLWVLFWSLLGLLVVGPLGVSTSINSSSQLDLSHQHILYLFAHSPQYSPIKFLGTNSNSLYSDSVRGTVIA